VTSSTSWPRSSPTTSSKSTRWPSPKTVSLPHAGIVKLNLKYKGATVDIQRIRARKSPKIEEVAPPAEAKTQQQAAEEDRLLQELSGQTGRKEQEPPFSVYALSPHVREEYSLENKGAVKALELDFDLSLLLHSRGIHLEASEGLVYLFVRGLYEVCLRLP
jgi:hypothetical protein